MNVDIPYLQIMVSGKFLWIVRKSLAFLVDRSDRGVTMSRGYRGLLNTTCLFSSYFMLSFRLKMVSFQLCRKRGGAP